MEKDKKFRRQEIDELRRQCLGKVVWTCGGLLEPDLDIVAAKCTGIKVETGEFRFEPVKGGLKGGTVIRQREQVFVSEKELQAFITKYNRDMQARYDSRGYVVQRCESIITIHPIWEDDWTGEEFIQTQTAEEDIIILSENEFTSKGYITVRDIHGTALSDAVLNAVRMAVKYTDSIES